MKQLKFNYDRWVISDTHFGHNNILNFKNNENRYFRGDLFDNVSHMNEVMVDNWNKVVKPGDKVYHLGDVFFGPKEDFLKLWPRLNGRKNLVVGNHDDIKFLASGGLFNKVQMWRVFPELNLVATHVPIHESSLKIWADYGPPSINIHGHIHGKQSPTKRHKCVCVEQTNYTPVLLESLGER